MSNITVSPWGNGNGWLGIEHTSKQLTSELATLLSK